MKEKEKREFLEENSLEDQKLDWVSVQDMFDEETVIMGGNPTPEISIEEMKQIASQVETEKELADAYAMASNKAWWVDGDLYE